MTNGENGGPGSSSYVLSTAQYQTGFVAVPFLPFLPFLGRARATVATVAAPTKATPVMAQPHQGIGLCSRVVMTYLQSELRRRLISLGLLARSVQ